MKNTKQKLLEIINKCDTAFVKNVLVVVGAITVWRGFWNAIGLEDQLASSLIALGIGILLLNKPTTKLNLFLDYIKPRK